MKKSTFFFRNLFVVLLIFLWLCLELFWYHYQIFYSLNLFLALLAWFIFIYSFFGLAEFERRERLAHPIKFTFSISYFLRLFIRWIKIKFKILNLYFSALRRHKLRIWDFLLLIVILGISLILVRYFRSALIMEVIWVFNLDKKIIEGLALAILYFGLLFIRLREWLRVDIDVFKPEFKFEFLSHHQPIKPKEDLHFKPLEMRKAWSKVIKPSTEQLIGSSVGPSVWVPPITWAPVPTNTQPNTLVTPKNTTQSPISALTESLNKLKVENESLIPEPISVSDVLNSKFTAFKQWMIEFIAGLEKWKAVITDPLGNSISFKKLYQEMQIGAGIRILKWFFFKREMYGQLEGEWNVNWVGIPRTQLNKFVVHYPEKFGVEVYGPVYDTICHLIIETKTKEELYQLIYKNHFAMAQLYRFLMIATKEEEDLLRMGIDIEKFKQKKKLYKEVHIILRESLIPYLWDTFKFFQFQQFNLDLENKIRPICLHHLKNEYQFMNALNTILPGHQFISLHSTGTAGEPDVVACRIVEGKMEIRHIQLKSTTSTSLASKLLKDFEKDYPHTDWLIVSCGPDIYIKENIFDSPDYKTRRIKKQKESVLPPDIGTAQNPLNYTPIEYDQKTIERVWDYEQEYLNFLEIKDKESKTMEKNSANNIDNNVVKNTKKKQGKTVAPDNNVNPNVNLDVANNSNVNPDTNVNVKVKTILDNKYFKNLTTAFQGRIQQPLSESEWDGNDVD